MEAHQKQRLFITLALVGAFSLFFSYNFQNNSSGFAGLSSFFGSSTKTISSKFSSYTNKLNSGAIDFSHYTNMVSPVTSSNGTYAVDEAFTSAPHSVNTNIVYGLTNTNTIWNIKLGPYSDSHYVQSLASYLMSLGYTVTVVMRKSYDGDKFSIYLDPSHDYSSAKLTARDLALHHNIYSTVTKNYT